jgi:kynurenine formamidase
MGNTFLKDFKSISVDRRGNIQIRGNPRLQMYSYPYTGQPGEISNMVCIPVRSITHFDILPSTPIWKMSSYLEPRYFENAVILNFSNKTKILREYLMEETGDLFSEVYPLLDLSKLFDKTKPDGCGGSKIIEILDKLLISADEIEKKFEDSKKKLDDFEFVIFRTDWHSEFYSAGNLDSKFFELFHAYLIHPYLNKKTIKELISARIEGISADTPELENPILFTNTTQVFPFVKEARRIAQKRGYISNDLLIPSNFVNIKTREGSNRYHIKNLADLNEVQGTEQVTTGKLLIIPIKLISDNTAIACEILFKEDT